MNSARYLHFAAFLFFLFIGMLFVAVVPVEAQICYSSRTVNQYACMPASCSGAGCCDGPTYFACSGDPSRPCPCGVDIEGGYPENNGTCVEICDNWQIGNECKVTGSSTASCDQGTCTWSGTIKSCQTSGSDCSETTEALVYGCWGPGGTPTTPASCGNGTCDAGEDCSS